MRGSLTTSCRPSRPALLKAIPNLTLLHQAGARNADNVRAAYQATGADPERWSVAAFLEDMASQFAAAHLVMARSGASTVAELAAAGKPSLLIPFAAAADDHQKSNAQIMVSADAALMIEERQLASGNLLIDSLVALLSDPTRLQVMGVAAKTQAHPAAAQQIAERLIQLISNQ